MGGPSLYNYFRVMYYLGSLMRHAYWSRDRLEGYQNRKVREIVNYAYDHVPFYHSKFKQLGLKPGDIKGVEDLNKLPIVRKEELQRSNETISNEFNNANLLVEPTSGSTGQPLFVYLTRREEEFRKAKLLRANINCGQKPRDRWAVIASPRPSNMARIQKWLGIFAPASSSVLDDTTAQISFVERFRPDVLESYSGSLLLIAKELEKRGIEIASPRLVIGGAELIGGGERRFIEKVFDAPFYDQYSSVEFDALSWECEERTGYHVDADTVVMQFVDEDGEEVAPGEKGEIVCTSLFNQAMPFIRYAIDDVGTSSEATECSCGRMLPLMKLVEGRKESFFVLPHGRVVSPRVIVSTVMSFKFYSYFYHFRIVQKKVDLIELIIQMKEDIVDRKVVKDELVAHFRKMLRITADEVALEVKFVENIPLDKSGKLAAVVSELKATNW